jgi:hypothetical protein
MTSGGGSKLGQKWEANLHQRNDTVLHGVLAPSEGTVIVYAESCAQVSRRKLAPVGGKVIVSRGLH